MAAVIVRPWPVAWQMSWLLLLAIALAACAATPAIGDETQPASVATAAGATPAPPAADEAQRSAPPVDEKPLGDDQIVEKIDELIRQQWAAEKISPSSKAPDGEWCRRVYLDILGRIPTVAELQKFVGDRSPRKRADLVAQLLTGEEYQTQYAERWATLWQNLLVGRGERNDRRSLVNREGMHEYLVDAFMSNKRYDKLAAELVSANGANKPGEDGFNGAVNFVLSGLEEGTPNATAKTARLFLGLQVQCTQCHNHPFNDWKQNQFWELDAFYRQAKPLRTYEDRYITMVRLEDEDFGGESNADPSKAEIFYELRNGKMAAAWPTFVDGTAINPSGYADEVNRRDELARLISTSPYLPQAIVNRTWAHFLGHGFTKPVDDMGPHNPPSHPELLDLVARQFAASEYDLKRLIRWITLSEAYSLSSRSTPRNARDDPALGERPMFSHFYLRQMRAEELYESLLVATEADKTWDSAGDQQSVRERWLDQFVVAFGTDEGDEATTFNGTIPQALMLMNGELTARATRIDAGSFLQRVAADGSTPREKINLLYNAALSRGPTTPELNAANEIVAQYKGNVVGALQDVWWALLNSNEFILNH